MNILNRARQIYKEKIKKQAPGGIAESIQAASDLKVLIDNPGWKRIEEFMDLQKKGSDELLERELGSINLLNFYRIVTSFLKYLYINQERRAYIKIRNFIRISIQKGEQNAERQRKTEEAKPKQ